MFDCIFYNEFFYFIKKEKKEVLVELTLPEDSNIYICPYITDNLLLQINYREWIENWKNKIDVFSKYKTY